MGKEIESEKENGVDGRMGGGAPRADRAHLFNLTVGFSRPEKREYQ